MKNESEHRERCEEVGTEDGRNEDEGQDEREITHNMDERMRLMDAQLELQI